MKTLDTAHFGRVLIAALAAGVLLAPGAQAAHPPNHPDKPKRDCLDDVRDRPGIGPSCRVAGGALRVQLRNGTTVETHGPDVAGDTAVAGPVVPRQPVCAPASPHGGYRTVAIVAWPRGTTPNETNASLRARIRELNGRLFADAVESGSPLGADYVFACDETGHVRVDRVELQTPAAAASFSTILSDLAVRGYAQPDEKYMVWYDNYRSGMPCGTGTLVQDERDSVSNFNNIGPDYGVSFDCDALMHEHGHNVGAVQYGSPFSTGTGAHCWSERDIMCYADGGNKYPGYLSYLCGDRDHFDCGFDDYFDAAVAEGGGGGIGSYLDRSWNIGECYVRWIVNYACSDTTPFPGFRRSGSATCGPGSPQWRSQSPLVFGFNPGAYDWIVWRPSYYRFDGATWTPAPPQPWYVSYASASEPAGNWWTMDTQAHVGAAPIERTFDPGPGQWGAMDEIYWFSQAGVLLASAQLIQLPGGASAVADSFVCNLP